MSSTQQLLLGEGAGGAAPVYIEDVFSTYLYTGTGSTQTITNGIDLSTKGGLLWIKNRTAANNNILFDTSRGANNYLYSNLTNASAFSALYNQSFTTSGFGIGSSFAEVNATSNNYVSWTFREQPKFFDVVTYTGNGASTQTISHNLGATPGCIIVKKTSDASRWNVYHRSLTAGSFLRLNTTAAQEADSFMDGANAPTSTTFTAQLATSDGLNANGATYVAYLFAHDAGGFGLTGTDNVISCGTFTTDAGGLLTAPITLGYEPQWVLTKQTDSANGWQMFDIMRAMPTTTEDAYELVPNTAGTESGKPSPLRPTATGFTGGTGVGSGTFIYVAIRRGPMKVPTVGTSVFTPVAYTGTDVDNRLVNTGIVTDLAWARIRDITTPSASGFAVADRFRGKFYVGTSTTSAQTSESDGYMQLVSGYGDAFSAMNGFGVGNNINLSLNQSSTPQLAYAFKRAAGFFDMVYYTGTGSARTVTHNLTVVPELIMTIDTSVGSGWAVYTATSGNTKFLELSETAALATSTGPWNNTTPTASVFTVGTASTTNASTRKYMAYLFATCAGVSKVGGYTGTGTTLQIDCGFTAGSRFVWIKRTDATGGWYVWDSARGIIAGNDPYLLTNSTAAEVTNTDYVDTYSAGFEISSTAPAAINANGGTFIFLAIA